MGKLVITDNMKKFVKNNKVVFNDALSKMARDIVYVTKMRIPFKSGNLYKLVEAVTTGLLKWKVVIDEKYAAYQERGARKDGSHQVRHYTTPGTGKDALKTAGRDITKDAIQYLKQAAHRVKAT